MKNIFICWSGDRSRRLASALQIYLPSFVPGLAGDTRDTTIFMSEDIAKGTRWFDEVEKELDSADAGVVCVTREALQSGWTTSRSSARF